MRKEQTHRDNEKKKTNNRKQQGRTKSREKGRANGKELEYKKEKRKGENQIDAAFLIYVAVSLSHFVSFFNNIQTDRESES